MIKVLEHGGAHYIGRCPRCGCRFEYDKADRPKDIIVFNCEMWVTCPECGGTFTKEKLDRNEN